VSFCFEAVYFHPSKAMCGLHDSPFLSLVNAQLEVQRNPLPAWAADLLSGQD
jgi:hypothetical protein